MENSKLYYVENCLFLKAEQIPLSGNNQRQESALSMTRPLPTMLSLCSVIRMRTMEKSYKRGKLHPKTNQLQLHVFRD